MIQSIVSALIPISEDIRILRLQPSVPYHYEAGQYAELTFEGFDPRPFSIANAPGATYLEFHIRGVGQGARAYAARELRVGDTVMISPSMGQCTYVAGCSKPILAIAGGIGLAPIKALLEEAIHHGHEAPIYLYFGGRIESDLYMRDDIATLGAAHHDFTLVMALSAEKNSQYRSGMIADVVLEDFDDLNPFRIYIGGPPAMIEASVPGLLAAGADLSCIHSDTTITMTRPETNSARERG